MPLQTHAFLVRKASLLVYELLVEAHVLFQCPDDEFAAHYEHLKSLGRVMLMGSLCQSDLDVWNAACVDDVYRLVIQIGGTQGVAAAPAFDVVRSSSWQQKMHGGHRVPQGSQNVCQNVGFCSFSQQSNFVQAFSCECVKTWHFSEMCVVAQNLWSSNWVIDNSTHVAELLPTFEWFTV